MSGRSAASGPPWEQLGDEQLQQPGQVEDLLVRPAQRPERVVALQPGRDLGVDLLLVHPFVVEQVGPQEAVDLDQRHAGLGGRQVVQAIRQVAQPLQPGAQPLVVRLQPLGHVGGEGSSSRARARSPRLGRSARKALAIATRSITSWRAAPITGGSRPPAAATIAAADSPIPTSALSITIRRVRCAAWIASTSRSNRSVVRTTSAASDDAVAPRAPIATPTPRRPGPGRR